MKYIYNLFFWDIYPFVLDCTDIHFTSTSTNENVFNKRVPEKVYKETEKNILVNLEAFLPSDKDNRNLPAG